MEDLSREILRQRAALDYEKNIKHGNVEDNAWKTFRSAPYGRRANAEFFYCPVCCRRTAIKESDDTYRCDECNSSIKVTKNDNPYQE